ncbi:MAG: hypothetical protein ACRC5Q_05930, partial [Culicoidibacterales bacterium]
NGKSLEDATSPSLEITPNKNVIVDTKFQLNGIDAPRYVIGDDSTISTIEPGVTGDYIVNITNNSVNELQKLDLYIPIPKTGVDYGLKYQLSPFNWDASIQAMPVLSGTELEFNFSDSDGDPELASYEIATELEDVKIVKISLKSGSSLASGETREIKIPVAVDETKDTAIAGNKIEKTNIYNPYYKIETGNFAGGLKGSTVAMRLNILEIKGFVFKDTQTDGIYQDTVDEPIAGAIVNLYEKQADGIYVASKDTFGNPIFATTGIDGRYIFDTTDGLIGFYLENGVIVKKQYAVQFLEIPGIKNDTQEFTKNTVYQDVANDNSSVNMNGDSRGFIEGIEALALGSGYLHAGVIDKYTITATIEGSVDTTTDLLFDETKTLDGNVDLGGPNFELFKASTNAYQWQLENPSDSQYIELDSTRTSNEDLDIHVKAIALHKIPISLTVTDIYGNTKKVIHYITVNQLPVISGAEDVTIKVGDVFDVMSGVTASDKEDDDQELTSKIKIITNTVN